VNVQPVRVFHSSGHPGYSAEISSDARRVFARKLPKEIDVRFTQTPCTVQTREGLVHAHPGDAIITGIGGEHWRVSRGHFEQRYRPVPPTVAGESGRYVSIPNRIMAIPMTEPFEVVLADGRSRLHGRAGDWLVDYGDGSLGVVSQAIFQSTYELVA